jgi:hypothetical protein
MDKFFALIEEKRIDKNELVDHLIGSWINDQEGKLLICPVCSAQYSSKIPNGCPQCNLKKRIDEKHQSLFNLETKKNKMLQWLAEGKAQPIELEKLETEITILKRELGLD